MQIFHDISNLISDVSIYLQVTIMVYKILFKNMCIMNTPYGKSNYNTVTKYIDELDIHLSRGSEEQCKNVKLQCDTS